MLVVAWIAFMKDFDTMMKAYNRLFYAILFHYMKRQSGNESPELMDAITAIVVLSCLMCCNVITLISFIRHFFIHTMVFSGAFGWLNALVVITLNVFLFLFKKKYRVIFYYFKESETERKYKRRNALCVAFIIVSIALMFIVPQ